MIRADRLVREEVAKLMSDERTAHPTFQGTLVWVLNNCKHLWIKATAEATMAMLHQGSPGARKRPFLADEFDTDKAQSPAGTGKKAQKKLEFKEKMKALKESKKQGAVRKTDPKPKAKGKGSSKGGSSGSEKGRIPAFEWTAVNELFKAKFCKFYNTSVGCQFNENCKQSHGCVLCGGDHGWFECPQRAK